MIELFGVVIIGGLIWLAVSASKGSGYKEAKLETSEAEITAKRVNDEKIKKVDIERVNTPIDKRLQQVNYRD